MKLPRRQPDAQRYDLRERRSVPDAHGLPLGHAASRPYLLVQRTAAVFIDDRALNVEPAHALGLDAILFEGLDALRAALKERGVHG